jgi:hypothetical protein
MNRSIPVIALLVSLAFAAQANDAVEPSFRMNAPVPAAAAKPAVAPFATKAMVAPPAVARDPAPQLPALEEQERAGPRGACRFALCYDAIDGHVAYRGAREYMPTFDGLTPESVSLRRNRIIFKYSFR